VALGQAGSDAAGGTAYVTLEPCAHLGHTQPCVDELIRAGIKRVIAAVEDPDPRVKGKGFAMLRRAGIDVIVGVLEAEAADLNAGFFMRINANRPLVVLKIAQSREGKTVPPATESRWITGNESRRFAHLLRAQHDAILIGVGTAIADDPELTCRLPGLGDRSPVRVILDTHLRLPVTAKIVRTARDIPTLLFTTADGGDNLRSLGVEVLRVMHDERGMPALKAVLGVLAGRGCTRLLIEGGATMWSQFLREGLADRLEIFTAPVEMGEYGTGEVSLLARLKASYVQTGRRVLGSDVLESYAMTA
jgi:diaminohydroxyphosphoribosylaminopyrimidine deaminase/5-amino-6-(5-phosphoribosylamino)uracil reductase